jgi:MFS family permease
MGSLAILLVIHDGTGSFADAGVAVGVFGAVGAAVSPALGRLVDHVGQVPVLTVTGAAQTAGFVALALGARHGLSLPAAIGLCALTGAALPPLSSCMRALWPELVRAPALRESAYTLDAISQELIWTLGPLIVAVLVAFASAAAALLVCAAFTAAGVALFVTSAVPRHRARAERRGSWTGALASRRIRLLLVCIAISSLGTGVCQVAIPAIGIRSGSSAAAGVLLGMWSIGSLLGGVCFGAVHWRSPVGTRYVGLYAVLAAVTLPLAAAHSVPAGIVLALLAGLPLAALISCQYTLVSAAAPGGAITEAFAWNSAAAFGALSAGAALGGWLVKEHGLGWAFVAAALAAAVAARVAASTVRA